MNPPWKGFPMKSMITIAACAVALTAGLAVTPLAVTPAHAAGCLKGAVVGGVAGHLAGHHGLIGAGIGCVVGHHEAAKRARIRAQHNRESSAGHRYESR
jgi:hypothetical protein